VYIQVKVILKAFLKTGFKCGLDSSGSKQGPMAGCSKHGNETPEPMKDGRIRELLINLKTIIIYSMTLFHGTTSLL
jgi:hypothetical protein